MFTMYKMEYFQAVQNTLSIFEEAKNISIANLLGHFM